MSDTLLLTGGAGYSVLQMLKAFEHTCGHDIAYKIVGRRPGDIATCFANPDKAKRQLGWQAKRGLTEMVRDAWRWQQQNPNGYQDL